jgi:hypothetical protein
MTLAIKDDKVQTGDSVYFNITTDKLYQFKYTPLENNSDNSLLTLTENGYLLTAFIPWSSINFAPTKNANLRLRLYLTDEDLGAETSVLTWPTSKDKQDPMMTLD